MVRAAKSNFYNQIFSDLNESNSIWKRLNHLGLIRSKSSTSDMLFSIEELCSFFSGASTQVISDPYYLGKETYSDNKLIGLM